MKWTLDRRVWLKWTAVALAALAVAYATRVGTSMSNEVHLTYLAPAGELRVTLMDSEGKRMRRTDFDDSEFKHVVVLPSGDYQVELIPQGHRPYRHTFTVSSDGAIEIAYPKSQPSAARLGKPASPGPVRSIP